MTSHEIRDRIHEFLEDDQNEYLKEVFLNTSKWFLELTREENKFVINRATTNADNELLKKISVIDKELRSWKKGALIRQIDRFVTSIRRLEMPAVNAQFSEAPIPEMDDHEGFAKYTQILAMDFNLRLVEQFEAAYEDFLVRPNVSSIYFVLELGHSIHLQLTSLSLALWDLRDQLDWDAGQPTFENELELTIWMSGSDKLQVIASKLTSLNEAYLELCKLLGVSAEDFPLRIGKLETGSLWLKVFGHNRIITLLVDGLTAVAHYLYRTQTRDGKFYATKDQISALEPLIDLQPKLEAMGVDTSEMKETIRKSTAQIAKNQLDFLNEESKVILNGSSFEIPLGNDRVEALKRFMTPKAIGEAPIEQKLLEGGDPESDQ